MVEIEVSGLLTMQMASNTRDWALPGFFGFFGIVVGHSSASWGGTSGILWGYSWGWALRGQYSAVGSPYHHV